MALGATATSVRRLVLAETVRLSGLGALIGLVGAVATGRLLRGMLFEIDPVDPSTMAAAALLLIVGSVFASYVPMRRATRVDSVATLRTP
jgi:ABC-type antimicrobial peptide transport system permease subunit